MSATVIARAGFRISRNHLVRSTGRPGRAIAVLVGVALIVGVLAALSYGFYASVLPGAFDPLPRSAPEVLRAAQRVLVVTLPVSSAVIASMLLVVVPNASDLRLSAQIAGATRPQVALGEFIPLAAALGLAAMAGTAGPVVFAAAASPSPALAVLGLLCLSLAITFAAATVAQLATAAAHRLAWPDPAARVAGMGAALVLLTAGLVDLIARALDGGAPVLVRVTSFLWHGRVLPDDPASLGATALVCAAAVGAAMGATALSGSRSALGAPPRLVPGPRSGRLPRPVESVLREMVLALRHPTGQLALAVSVMLAAAFVVLGRVTQVPADAIVLALAVVCSSGAELAHGRTARWAWVYRSGGVSALRRVVAQTIAIAVLGVVPLVLGVIGLGGDAAVIAARSAGAVLTLAMLVAVGHLAGVLIPFDTGAPTGMLLTATIAVALDGVLLWATTSLAGTAPLLSEVAETVVAVLAVLAAAGVTRLREAFA